MQRGPTGFCGLFWLFSLCFPENRLCKFQSFNLALQHIPIICASTQDFDLSTNYGDRRQEIVFIGVGMQEDKICEQLDGALLTDAEMLKYDERYAKEQDPVHPRVDELRKPQAKA